MAAYRLELTADEGLHSCGRIGGIVHLPQGADWPRCKMCSAAMVAFLEVTLPAEAAPFQPGSRLQIFACREHDDIAGTIYSDYGRFLAASRSLGLPTGYWNLSDGHYLLQLIPPSAKTAPSRPEARLLARFLTAAAIADNAADGFRLFGEPNWLQDSEEHVCSCGASMKLLLQVPAGQGFTIVPGAEPQPNSFSVADDCLFLGNQLILLACTRQCHPQALWPVLQS